MESFIETLPVEKFYGVGKVTAEKMKKMNLHTGADLKKLTEQELVKYFGKAGNFYYNIVRGVDERKVEPEREIKSLGAEHTFFYDLTMVDEMKSELDKIAQTVYERLQKNNLSGRTITLKIKYSNFTQITRNQSFPYPIEELSIIQETAKRLLVSTGVENSKIRLLGISISNFREVQNTTKKQEDTGQLNLF